jgi:hypothetical protein
MYAVRICAVLSAPEAAVAGPFLFKKYFELYPRGEESREQFLNFEPENRERGEKLVLLPLYHYYCGKNGSVWVLPISSEQSW